jgi:hypothetical protein
LQDKYNKSKENKSVLQIKMVGLKIPSAIWYYYTMVLCISFVGLSLIIIDWL